MKFRTNDFVYILAGDDRGKTGTITKILKKENKVIVEGINKTIKHVKKKEGAAGEIVEFFAPIHISNIAIYDSKNKKPTRIGYKLEGKTKTRINKKSGDDILANAGKAKRKDIVAVSADK